jgi:hypothetical protein
MTVVSRYLVVIFGRTVQCTVIRCYRVLFFRSACGTHSLVITNFPLCCGWDLAEWLERLTVNVVVATVLGSIPVSSDTVESEGRQMKQC